ncbi:hypothetical protein [Paenibacillus sp. PvR148]
MRARTYEFAVCRAQQTRDKRLRRPSWDVSVCQGDSETSIEPLEIYVLKH